MHPDQDRTHNSGMHPAQELNVQILGVWNDTPTNWGWILSLLKKSVSLREVDLCIHTHMWSSGTGFGPGGAIAAISKNGFYLKQSMEKMEFKITV